MIRLNRSSDITAQSYPSPPYVDPRISDTMRAHLSTLMVGLVSTMMTGAIGFVALSPSLFYFWRFFLLDCSRVCVMCLCLFANSASQLFRPFAL
jgi:hypothetical protein